MRYFLVLLWFSVGAETDRDRDNSHDLERAYNEIASLKLELVHLQEELDLCTEGCWCPWLVDISDKGPCHHMPNKYFKCLCPLRVCTLLRLVARARVAHCFCIGI